MVRKVANCTGIRPDRNGNRSAIEDIAPEGAIGHDIEFPADGLSDQQEEDQGQPGGDDDGGGHAPEVALVIGSAAHLAVQGGTPVRPQVEEHDHRDQGKAGHEGERAELAKGRAGCLTGGDCGGVVIHSRFDAV